MDTRKRILAWTAVLLALGAVAAHYLFDPWGFYWKVTPEESQLRLSLVETAQGYLGCKESDGSHKAILALYNAQEVLPVGYAVQETDSWCSTFVSAMAIEAGLTEIIPMECGCQRHIGLFQEIGRWIEEDGHIPLPGDLIFYDWDVKRQGESTGWADHVGIVVGTKWPFVKVIEGNKDDAVSYRILRLGDMRIRGYGVPDYAGLIE
ncbi:MAG: CHAP domain-containing protein [Oscillospiraceae bacterium]|nr:CHAP domain-containing protein [Oscillospiraceae bacterium]